MSSGADGLYVLEFRVLDDVKAVPASMPVSGLIGSIVLNSPKAKAQQCGEPLLFQNN